jgi:hypothetical protein
MNYDKKPSRATVPLSQIIQMIKNIIDQNDLVYSIANLFISVHKQLANFINNQGLLSVGDILLISGRRTV